MERPTETEIDALKAEHKNVFTFEKNEFYFLLRRPKGIEYRRHQSKIAEDRKALYDANQELSLVCTVWPKREVLMALFDDYPGFVSEVGAELLALAHNSEKAEAKKA